MPTTALNAQKHTIDYDGDSDIEGAVLACPVRTGKPSQLSVVIWSDADPGAFQFIVEGSNDGVVFVEVDTIDSLMDTEAPVALGVPNWQYLFVKISQVSKANDVVSHADIAYV